MPQQPATSFADDLAKARADFQADLDKARKPVQAPGQGQVNTEKRGFFSAAKDILYNIPHAASVIAQDTAATMFPGIKPLQDAQQQRQMAQAEDMRQGVQAHGLPREIVHQVGNAFGIPSHDLVKDYDDKNWTAFSGDIAAPIAFAEGVRAGVNHGLPAVKAALDRRAAGKIEKITGQQVSDLMKAVPPSQAAPYDMSSIRRARPYLEAEHASSPITTVEHLVDAANSSVTQIEERVGQYIAANPNDLIRTNPLAAARRALSRIPRTDAMAAGLKELEGMGFEKDMTVQQADAARLQLNAENDAILKKNRYDIATARRADPGFAAREAASQALRDGVYDQLEARGIEGVRELRQDEGALLSIRNAAQRQVYAGEKNVAGTGSDSAARRIASRGVTLAGAGIGGLTGGSMGGPVGAGVGATAGATVGRELGGLIQRPNLSHDALIARSFESSRGLKPTYPTIPDGPAIRGQLGPGAHPMTSGPDASGITTGDAALGDFQIYPTSPQRLIGQGARPMPSAPDPSRIITGDAALGEFKIHPSMGYEPPAPRGLLNAAPDPSGISVSPANRGQAVRDPKTGRFKRVFTSEGIR